LSAQSYILGDSFSAADVLIASNLHFAIDVFKMVEPRPEFSAYLERCRSRPAFYCAKAIDDLGV
jgi:glutathione S-transferase